MKLALLLLLAFLVVLLLPRPAPRAGQQTDPVPESARATERAGIPPTAADMPAARVIATAVSPRPSGRYVGDMAALRPDPESVRTSPAPVAAAESAGPRGAAPTLSGIASWYPGSRGFVGTPHAAIPGGRWTGRINGWAVVCAFVPGHDPCLTVPLVDFCACRVGSSRRDIDLSIDAVRALGLDPARGLYRISLEVLRP